MSPSPLPTVPLVLLLAACASHPYRPGSGSETARPAEPVRGEGTRPAPALDPAAEREAIAVVIDDWHAAAAEADEERYLGYFDEGAVFLGTDATERWTLEEFTAYVRRYFPEGGWTYEPHDRHVMLTADGELAWFDEQLTNAGYGELRGTGVLRKREGRWRLVHYSMTFTVPNGVAKEIVARIKAWSRAR